MHTTHIGRARKRTPAKKPVKKPANEPCAGQESPTDTRNRQVSLAKQRLEEGEGPTEDAEREWERMLRRREMRAEMITRKADELRTVQGDLQTTAVPRPNAYLPEVSVR